MAQKTDRTTANRQIDDNLRRVYDDALQEQLPEKFVVLIQRLKDEEKAGHKENDDD
jgi:hypothetical protein